MGDYMINLKTHSYSRLQVQGYILNEKLYIFGPNDDNIMKETDFAFHHYEDIKVPTGLPIGKNGGIITNDTMICYWTEGEGLFGIDKIGCTTTLISVNDIEALDYLSLGRTNIWRMAMYESDRTAIFDNSEKVIREIKKAA